MFSVRSWSGPPGRRHWLLPPALVIRVSFGAAIMVIGACEARPTVSNTPDTSYTPLWRDASVRSEARSAFDDSSVFFLDGNHLASAVDKRTGLLRWQTQLTYPTPQFLIGYGMAVAGDRLIVGDDDVFGMDRRTGAVDWRFGSSLPGERTGHSHITTDGSVVYCGSTYGNLYAVDAATGVSVWTTHVVPDSNVNINDPILYQGIIYVGFLTTAPPPSNGGAAAIDARTGNVLWATWLPVIPNLPGGSPNGVAVSPELVVVGSLAGPVYGLDRLSGNIQYVLPESTFNASSGQNSGGNVYVLTSVGATIVVGAWTSTVIGLDGHDLHTLWRTVVPGAVYDMSTDSSRVYIVSSLNEMTALRASDGTLVWHVNGVAFAQASGSLEQFVAAPSMENDRVYLGGSVSGVYAFKRK